jgi:hypothetical protein
MLQLGSKRRRRRRRRRRPLLMTHARSACVLGRVRATAANRQHAPACRAPTLLLADTATANHTRHALGSCWCWLGQRREQPGAAGTGENWWVGSTSGQGRQARRRGNRNRKASYAIELMRQPRSLIPPRFPQPLSAFRSRHHRPRPRSASFRPRGVQQLGRFVHWAAVAMLPRVQLAAGARPLPRLPAVRPRALHRPRSRPLSRAIGRSGSVRSGTAKPGPPLRWLALIAAMAAGAASLAAVRFAVSVVAAGPVLASPPPLCVHT